MLEQVVVQSESDRYAAVSRVHNLPQRMQERQHLVATNSNVGNKTLSFANRKAIINELSFLKPYQNFIHSLVLVGSTVYNAQTSNSDIDLVIIATKGGYAKVCDVLFEKEIDESLNRVKGLQFEYTVLSSRQTEELFQVSSPFAYSIRHGIVFQDDGYLVLLCSKRYPLLPEREYYTTCLYENIATPYYGMLKKFQSETRERGCSLLCRRKNSGCEGLRSAHLFAKLIMQMLYVTLPSRGMIPLTKTDVIAYAKKAYGSQGGNMAKQVVSLMRDKRSSFCFDEFKLLRRFAVQLFREILRITGFSSDVREIIVDAARVIKGDYSLIRNPAMKNCVL